MSRNQRAQWKRLSSKSHLVLDYENKREPMTNQEKYDLEMALLAEGYNVLESIGASEINLEASLEANYVVGMNWLYMSRHGYHSVRVNKNGFWQQVGPISRFGRCDGFKEAVTYLATEFHWSQRPNQ